MSKQLRKNILQIERLASAKEKTKQSKKAFVYANKTLLYAARKALKPEGYDVVQGFPMSEPDKDEPILPSITFNIPKRTADDKGFEIYRKGDSLKIVDFLTSTITEINAIEQPEWDRIIGYLKKAGVNYERGRFDIDAFAKAIGHREWFTYPNFETNAKDFKEALVNSRLNTVPNADLVSPKFKMPVKDFLQLDNDVLIEGGFTWTERPSDMPINVIGLGIPTSKMKKYEKLIQSATETDQEDEYIHIWWV